MIIIGVDPGKTTGWSMLDVGEHVTEERPRTGELHVNQFWDWALDQLPEIGRSGHDVMIACERFVISGGTVKKSRTDENWSIGQIELLRHVARRERMGFRLQDVGDAKKFAPDDRLRKIGWYTKGRGHANDATRHLLLWIADNDVVLRDVILSRCLDAP